MRAISHLAVAVLCAASSHAQTYPVSERGSVTQTVAYTEISVWYGRPSARGRELFGHLVPWDDVWHPGADSATRIVFSRDVMLEGHAVKAGEYSIWMIPREKAPWTFILSREAHVFHRNYPGADQDALRVDVTPQRGTFMETLTFWFPAVQREDATLGFQWGEVMLSLHIQAPNHSAS